MYLLFSHVCGSKYIKNAFAAGLLSKPRWRSLQRFPIPRSLWLDLAEERRKES